MFYIFLPSLGECGRLDTDNVSPEIENLIILSTSLHSTLAGALIRFIINKIPSVPPQAGLTSDKAAGRLLWLGIVKLELSWQESYEFPSEICKSTRTSILATVATWSCHYS